jgi:hypothetical protein
MSAGGPDRRGKRRFAIDRDVKYRVLRADRVAEQGTGRTVNISSSGVYFTSENTLPLAAPLELSISWPALLNESCPMKLTIHGSVVRSDAHGTAVNIERYEFRTQGRAIQVAALPFGAALKGVDLTYR